MRKETMNRPHVRPAVAAALLLPSLAFGTVAPPLPPPAFADTEVSAYHALAQGLPGGLRLRLEFCGTPSNNVEVALGTDANADGVLAFDETALVVGWDCGRYFVECMSTGERHEETSVGTNDSARVFAWDCAAKRGRPKSLSVATEAGAAFEPLATALPDWLYDGNWNLMRLTARGTDAQDECFTFETLQNGFRIRLK